jgi:hypothetical protein
MHAMRELRLRLVERRSRIGERTAEPPDTMYS